MTKIVINTCYGSFSLSNKGVKRYAKLKGMKILNDTGGYRISYLGVTSYFNSRDIPRTDPCLAQVVEELRSAANGIVADLKIVELPPGTRYRIQEYDGREMIVTEASIEWEIA